MLDGSGTFSGAAIRAAIVIVAADALELVVAVASGERGPHSRDDLAALKAGCAGIAAWLRHGQRRYRGDARHAG